MYSDSLAGRKDRTDQDWRGSFASFEGSARHFAVPRIVLDCDLFGNSFHRDLVNSDFDPGHFDRGSSLFHRGSQS